jgi:hypothetical protein
MSRGRDFGNLVALVKLRVILFKINYGPISLKCIASQKENEIKHICFKASCWDLCDYHQCFHQGLGGDSSPHTHTHMHFYPTCLKKCI